LHVQLVGLNNVPLLYLSKDEDAGLLSPGLLKNKYNNDNICLLKRHIFLVCKG